MPKVNRIRLLSERTSGAPPVIFVVDSFMIQAAVDSTDSNTVTEDDLTADLFDIREVSFIIYIADMF